MHQGKNFCPLCDRVFIVKLCTFVIQRLRAEQSPSGAEPAILSLDLDKSFTRKRFSKMKYFSVPGCLRIAFNVVKVLSDIENKEKSSNCLNRGQGEFFFYRGRQTAEPVFYFFPREAINNLSSAILKTILKKFPFTFTF